MKKSAQKKYKHDKGIGGTAYKRGLKKKAFMKKKGTCGKKKCNCSK